MLQLIQKSSPEKRRLIYALFVPFIMGLLMLLSFLLEQGMGWDFHSAGVFPRRPESIWGVISIVFVHADWGHLFNNLISFLLLSCALFLFYREISTRVFFLSYLFSGLILWIIGRENWHVGASGLIYSLAFFVFFSGLLRKYTPLIALSFVVAFIYGSMVWHLFPWQQNDPVSWEGHLSGGIVGIVLSIVFRNQEPQAPVKEWDDQEDEDELDYMCEDLSDDEEGLADLKSEE